MEHEALEQLQQQLLNLGGDPHAALELCADYGITVLGLGRSRLAIPKSEQEVYKLAWRSLGLAENSLEHRVYQQAPEDLRAVLAPAIELHQAGILIQGRCQPTDLGAEAAAVLQTLSRYGIVDGVLNLGRYQQRVVCYDYALLGTERFFQVTAD